MKNVLRSFAISIAAVVLVCLVCGNSLAGAQKQPDAVRILTEAQAQAAVQHKDIFLVFGASWCHPCRLLDEFLAAPDMKLILEKHFVFADMHIEEDRGKNPQLETAGGADLAIRLGAGKQAGVPYIVFLNEKGERIVTSVRPGADNIGYPVLPDEITWFMTMLETAVPSLSKSDEHLVEQWLRKKSKSVA